MEHPVPVEDVEQHFTLLLVCEPVSGPKVLGTQTAYVPGVGVSVDEADDDAILELSYV